MTLSANSVHPREQCEFATIRCRAVQSIADKISLPQSRLQHTEIPEATPEFLLVRAAWRIAAIKPSSASGYNAALGFFKSEG